MYVVVFLLVSLFGTIAALQGASLRTPSATLLHDPTPQPPQFPWQAFPREMGFSEGLRKFVANSDQNLREHNVGEWYPQPTQYSPTIHVKPTDDEKLPPVQCYLDEEQQTGIPPVWAYQGQTEHAPEPMLGAYEPLGLNADICFDRYGRYAAYGLGQTVEDGGTGLGLHGDMLRTSLPCDPAYHVEWRKIDLGRAQEVCVEKNKRRFAKLTPAYTDDVLHRDNEWPLPPGPKLTIPSNSSYVPRTAIVLRLWDGYHWTNYSHLYIRSLVSELTLHSKGLYQVHLLVEIKDGSPIFASDKVYDEVLARVVPPEYRSMATLWSQQLMEMMYPGPYEPHFDHTPGKVQNSARSMHMALTWFAQFHAEYDFFWNWEMDVRYIGHWYELFSKIDSWAERQPRRALWERSGRFYIPSAHGSWDDYAVTTERRSVEGSDTNELVSGPQYFEGWDESDRADVLGAEYLQSLNISAPSDSPDWGVGEPADFITLLPQFNPDNTFWIFRADVNGYSTEPPIPPRRASIVTSSRFSLRMLSLIHRETFAAKHAMCGEMFPASIALHYGLKSVFAPHPMYFANRWNDSTYIESKFNANPRTGESGDDAESVFSEVPQHNFRGGTYYYDSGFAERLWMRWLGYKIDGEGGAEWETGGTDGNVRGRGQGRTCLRSMLLHPVKHEYGES
jgi:hypothetical protein